MSAGEPLVKYGNRTVYLVTNPEGDSYLSCGREASEGHTSVPAEAGDLDVEVVAEFLDQQEENENRHELVGAYSRLAVILHNNAVGRTAIRNVLVSLLERGGLCD